MDRYGNNSEDNSILELPLSRFFEPRSSQLVFGAEQVWYCSVSVSWISSTDFSGPDLHSWFFDSYPIAKVTLRIF